MHGGRPRQQQTKGTQARLRCSLYSLGLHLQVKRVTSLTLGFPPVVHSRETDRRTDGSSGAQAAACFHSRLHRPRPGPAPPGAPGRSRVEVCKTWFEPCLEPTRLWPGCVLTITCCTQSSSLPLSRREQRAAIVSDISRFLQCAVILRPQSRCFADDLTPWGIPWRPTCICDVCCLYTLTFVSEGFSLKTWRVSEGTTIETFMLGQLWEINRRHAGNCDARSYRPQVLLCWRLRSGPPCTE